jgi:hypothetical protein
LTDRSLILRPEMPCPFCGAPGAESHAEEVADNVWSVICGKCGSNGPLDFTRPNTASRAVGDWDRRPSSRFDTDLSQALNEGDGSYRP